MIPSTSVLALPHFALGFAVLFLLPRLLGQFLSLLVSEKSNIGIAAEGVNTEALQSVADQYAARAGESRTGATASKT